MKKTLQFITPNKVLTNSSALTIGILWLMGTLAIWTFSGSKVFPAPMEIIQGGHDLFVKNDFLTHLFISTWLCIKAIFYASVISLSIALLSVIPIFRPFTGIAGKARFLSTVGLVFIFAQLTSDTNSLKITLLVFCIGIFMVKLRNSMGHACNG